MTTPAPGHDRDRAAPLASPDHVLATLLAASMNLPAGELTRVVDLVGTVLGAASARVLIADYGLTSLQELGDHGPTGPRQPIEGTLAGRAFARGAPVESTHEPFTVWIPLAEGSERLGVLELVRTSWTDEVQVLADPVVRILVLVLTSKQRYTDQVVRSRRSEALSLAAEIQWDLLPPLTYSIEEVSIGGILEPAYSIGGDSFDFAHNSGQVEFAIIDAVGRGMSAVMLSVAAINGLRNARREGSPIDAAYVHTDATIRQQFGSSQFVTAQIGSLDIDTGALTWLNAGHPLPLLVRDGQFTGELRCRPSLPLGLGEGVTEIADERLQPGDRVLFYTDGVVETRSTDGRQFGIARLADYLVRATHDRLSPAETLRRLSSSIMAYNGDALGDDATLLLVEYHGSSHLR